MAALAALRGVFFAEFHAVQGPRIASQAPEGLLSAEVFDSIAEYIIPKPQLCGRLVMVCTETERIMSFPVSIESNKYERNALIFNLGFVFSLEDDDLRSYEPVVRKLAKVFRTLEVERQFLSSDARSHLDGLLTDMLESLNRLRECHLTLELSGDAAGRPSYIVEINLKLFPPFPEPGPLHDHEVPVLTTPLLEYVGPDWDLTTRRILPHIDGINYVKRIAAVTDIDIHLVRECLQNLRYYGALHMIDIFQFSNVYVLTDAIHDFYTDVELQRECAVYCAMDEDRAVPGPNLVFAAFACFQHGRTVGAIAADGRFAASNIDIRRLVTFGLVRGLLRRVHIYVVPVRPTAAATSGAADGGLTVGIPAVSSAASLADVDTPVLSTAGRETSKREKRLRRLLTHPRTLDDLCVALGMGAADLLALVQREPDLQMVQR